MGKDFRMYEILLVDDEASSRNILASCFPWEDLGFHVCGQADNGLAALDFLKEHRVHVVFTDIQMPEMDGVALAREIHRMPPPRPLVVFLSAYSDFSYAQQAIMYNVRYYALKPSSFSELTDVFTRIRDELAPADPPQASLAEAPSTDETIQKVLDYCRRNYKSGSLEELSGQLFLNPSYLSTLIRQKTGHTFSEYLMDIRMQQAAQFLQDPSIKIYCVSEMVGYTNQNNFARMFRSHFHMSPSEYRNAQLRKTPSAGFPQ